MGPQEGSPRHPLLPDGIKTVLQKDPLDRVPTDLVSQVVERSSDPRIAPARVIAGHPDDQLLDFDRGLRTAGLSALAAIVLPGDQLSVPSKQSVWRHQGVEPEERFPADRLGLDRKSTALRIRERNRFGPSCSRRARFSSCRYSITSCWWRFTHPAKSNIKNCSCGAFIDSILGQPNRIRSAENDNRDRLQGPGNASVLARPTFGTRRGRMDRTDRGNFSDLLWDSCTNALHPRYSRELQAAA